MDRAFDARRPLALLYGLICHALFAAGVAMMIWQMYFGMSRSFGNLSSPANWLANAALLAQFPVAHSMLLSARGRALLAALAPKPHGATLVTTLYVIVASLQVLLLFSLWTYSGQFWWQAEGFSKYLLTLLYAASWLLLGKAILDAGITLQTGWLGWWAMFRNARPAYPGMPVRGLFRYCRQPIYLAFACTLWTVPVWTPDQLVIAMTLTAYCLIGPLFKEARFAKIFGDSFTRYQVVHSYFLPSLGKRGTHVTRNDLSIYDRFAAQWWDGSVRWLRVLQNLVPARMGYFDTHIDWRGKDVLDIGCGGGFMSEALAQRGASVTGIDPAASAIAIAKAHAASRSLGITYHVAAGEALPVPGQSMDHVVCVDVLEHVRDLGRVLDEVRRVLRPGGSFAFDTINDTALARFVIIVLGEHVLHLLPKGTHDPSLFIAPDRLRHELEQRGFIDCRMTGLGPRGLNRSLDFTFGSLSMLSIQYMGIARRG